MEKNENKSLKKDFVWNTLGSILNSFNSLFFMVVVTRINGISDAGIFTFAFSTACLFNIIGVYSGRVFQVSDQSSLRNTDFFYNKVLTCFLMLIVSVCFILINGYSGLKAWIIFILCVIKCLEAFVEVIYAYFQKAELLYKVGISLSLKSVISLLAFILVDVMTKSMLYATISLLIVYITLIVIYDSQFLNLKLVKFNDLNLRNILLIFKKGFFVFILSFFTLFILNVPRYAIDNYLTEDFSTIFGILIMPASVIVLVSQFILHPFLVKLTVLLKHKNYSQFKNMVLRISLSIFVVGLFSLVVAYLLGIPVLELVYRVKLSEYHTALIIVMIGATLNGVVTILSNVLITLRINFLQVIIYAIATIISLPLTYNAVYEHQIIGACISYTLVIFIVFILFLFLVVLSLRKMEVACND